MNLEDEDLIAQERIISQPYIFQQLAENALLVSESLRENYFKNTASFISTLRKRIRTNRENSNLEPILSTFKVGDINWQELKDEIITFIDGGLGATSFSGQTPILLRVGSYCVRTGERNISEREQFGYYPVIFGDLEGGSKERKDFPDIVRITAELLGGLAALERTKNLKALLFHGPLVYLMSAYAGHSPFTEQDIDKFLTSYGANQQFGRELKAAFLLEAAIDIYPAMTSNFNDWINKKLFEPLSWIAFLYRRLIKTAKERQPAPLIAGIVERGRLREFCETIILQRVFKGLRTNNNLNYFNNMFGRNDLITPKALIDRLGYTDGILLSMLLEPGEYTEYWRMNKYDGLRTGEVSLPNEAGSSNVNFSPLATDTLGFPKVLATYLSVLENTEPIRLETFEALGMDQIEDIARRTYLYSRLLPGYGFPIGLDIADKFAHVPNWLTSAYAKMIQFQLGVSLQRGEITDKEMRRIVIQSIYMTKRDWLFRPKA